MEAQKVRLKTPPIPFLNLVHEVMHCGVVVFTRVVTRNGYWFAVAVGSSTE